MSNDGTMMERRFVAAFVAAFFVACWCLFFFVLPYTLFAKEQTSLFTSDWPSVAAYFSRPAVLTSLAGDYLTQFYLLVGGGATLLAASLLLLWRGVLSALRRFGAGPAAALWALLPVAAEALLSAHIEYPLSMSLGAACAVWCFVVWSRRAAWRSAAIVVPVLYLLAGAHCLLFAVTAAAYLATGRRWAGVAAVAAVYAAVPAIAGPLFRLTVAQSYFYPLIECYLLRDCSSFLLVEAAMMLAVAAVFVRRCPAWAAAATVAIAAAAGGMCGVNLRSEYAYGISSEAYFGHWDRVEKMAGRNWKYKTYLGSYYSAMALARKDSLGERLTEFYQPSSNALLLPADEKSDYTYVMASCDALSMIGDMANAQRAALLAMMQMPRQQSSRVMRSLADMAIVAGEYGLADKFLRRLEHTALHRRWAESRRRLIADSEAVAATPWVAERRARLVRRDTLLSANDRFAALYALAEADGGNRAAVEYLLSYHLLNKDLKRFKTDYDRYFYPRFGGCPPTVFQQALLMCIEREEDYAPTVERYRIEHSVQRDCFDYLDAYAQSGGDGAPLMPRFGRSYWFYYYYAQMIG